MTSAARTRRYRQRRRDGLVHVRFVMGAGCIANLTALGWLQPGASEKQARAAILDMLRAAFDARILPKAGM
jgi:hypothetical protein